MTRKTTLTCGLLAAALLGGCGGEGGDDVPASTEASTATPTATTTRTATPEPSLRTVEYATADSGTFRFRVDSLRREGAFLTLNATVACVRPFEEGDDCDTQIAFGGRPDDNNVFAGVTAVDPAGQRAYDTVRAEAENGDPYSAALDPDLLPTDPARRVWARFAAPPADVTSVDLLLPQGGPRLDAVPITEGGGVETSPPPSGIQAAEPAEFPVPPESQDATGLAMGDSDIQAATTSKRRRVQDRRGQRTVTLAADVLFSFDSARLGPGGDETLREVSTQITDNASDGRVAIDGYTDSKGSDAYNLDLSRERAETVRSRLEGAVEGRDLRARGRGEADPVAPNTIDGSDNPAGRRKNRRVTVGYTLQRGQAQGVATPEPSATPAPVEAPAPQAWSYSDSTGDRSELTVLARGVRRVGNLSVLELDVRCDASESTSEDCDQQYLLAREAGAGNDSGGVVLTDPARDVTYSAAEYEGSYFDTVGSLVRLRVGQTQRVSVYFAAIPSSTASVTVRLPNGGPQLVGVPVR